MKIIIPLAGLLRDDYLKSSHSTMDKQLSLSKNAVVAYLQKPASQFTKADIIRFIEENEIGMVNFMYPASDGRLKTLNFVVNNREYLETILTYGERVDGSSLFPFIEAGNSDLYAIPRYRTAFVDPFAPVPTLTMLCSYFDRNGSPLELAPEHTLKKACRALRESTGLDFEAMGELEYYIIAPASDAFPATDQRGYHESAPFAKYNDFRQECMAMIASTGGMIKYGHSEVGNFTARGTVYEQCEIEFLPCPAEEAADQLMIAKWVIRNLAWRRGLDITFAPKITTGKAGSGMHIHMRLMRDGQNQMLNPDRTLSDIARRAIAGMMELAPSITAFGNKNPASYLRLVPHQEAPTDVCWGASNRTALVRVPLGWTSGINMSLVANPLEAEDPAYDASSKQTVEMRSPDGSANVYQLMAALAVACRRGLEMDPAEALRRADETFIDTGCDRSKFDSLPDCCVDSAERLNAQRQAYEAEGVFSPKMIDGIIDGLRAWNDRGLRQKLSDDPKALQQLVDETLHCG